MQKIKPINGHLLIKPKVHRTLLPTGERDVYEEIGIVIGVPGEIEGTIEFPVLGDEIPEIGDEVYFDKWLSAKFPTGEGDEFFWLVPFKDVRAIKRHEENKISG